MAVKTRCVVTNVIHDGAAFCIRLDNDEAAYIPVNLVASMELEELDEIDAVMKVNDRMPERTPWFVIRARKAA